MSEYVDILTKEAAWSPGKAMLVETLMGAVLGAGAGAGIGAATYKPVEPKEWSDEQGRWWVRDLSDAERKDRRQSALLGALLGAGAGAGLGAGVRAAGVRSFENQASEHLGRTYNFLYNQTQQALVEAAKDVGKMDTQAGATAAKKTIDDLLSQIGQGYQTHSKAISSFAKSEPYMWALGPQKLHQLGQATDDAARGLIDVIKTGMAYTTEDLSDIDSRIEAVQRHGSVGNAQAHPKDPPPPERKSKKVKKSSMHKLTPKGVLGTNKDWSPNPQGSDTGKGEPGPGVTLSPEVQDQHFPRGDAGTSVKVALSVNGKNITTTMSRLRRSFGKSTGPSVVGMPKAPKPEIRTNTKQTVQKLQGSL